MALFSSPSPPSVKLHPIASVNGNAIWDWSKKLLIERGEVLGWEKEGSKEGGEFGKFVRGQSRKTDVEGRYNNRGNYISFARFDFHEMLDWKRWNVCLTGCFACCSKCRPIEFADLDFLWEKKFWKSLEIWNNNRNRNIDEYIYNNGREMVN